MKIASKSIFKQSLQLRLLFRLVLQSILTLPLACLLPLCLLRFLVGHRLALPPEVRHLLRGKHLQNGHFLPRFLTLLLEGLIHVVQNRLELLVLSICKGKLGVEHAGCPEMVLGDLGSRAKLRSYSSHDASYLLLDDGDENGGESPVLVREAYFGKRGLQGEVDVGLLGKVIH